MSTLRDIRSRIQSVQNIKQITKSMEMVAAARLHKAIPKAEYSHLYAEHLLRILKNIISSAKDVLHPLFKLQKSPKSCLIIISSDQGLSGPYNSNLFANADQFLKNYTKDSIELILFGKKAIEYYKRKDWNIIQTIENWSGKITFQEIEQFTSDLVDAYLSSDFHEVFVEYTQYINTFVRKVTIEKFLNIERPEADKIPPNYIFEPNPPELLEEILPRFIIAKMAAILNQAYASELAARVASMRTATKNAEDMIEDLTLLRNKVRQAGITKEILEITSGAEAMK